FNPGDRRYRYPFLNCTDCGPRASIIDALPYDRVRTTMRAFDMCAACAGEYTDPTNRRFHAEPIACPACGPRLGWDAAGRGRRAGSHTEDALGAAGSHAEDALGAAEALARRGGILALKGLGGYQLVCDATNDAAVTRLRTRKHRPAKPFAVMVPSLAAA